MARERERIDTGQDVSYGHGVRGDHGFDDQSRG
jgi:hypothetical protein